MRRRFGGCLRHARLVDRILGCWSELGRIGRTLCHGDHQGPSACRMATLPRAIRSGRGGLVAHPAACCAPSPGSLLDHGSSSVMHRHAAPRASRRRQPLAAADECGIPGQASGRGGPGAAHWLGGAAAASPKAHGVASALQAVWTRVAIQRYDCGAEREHMETSTWIGCQLHMIGHGKSAKAGGLEGLLWVSCLA